MSSSGQNFCVVKFKSGKHQFEVLAKPNTMALYREGKIGIDNVVAHDVIFKSSSKGEVAPEAELAAAFPDKPKNVDRIREVLDHGEFQLSSSERQERMDQKRKQIVNYIHKYYADPSTKKPHPVLRIEQALDSIKARIDMDKEPERQAQDLISKLVEVIPLKRTEITGTLYVPHAHLGQAQGIIAKLCQISSQKYDGSGCTMEISLTPGDYDDLSVQLARVTKGDFNFEILGAQAAMATTEEPAAKGKGKAGKKK
eukprot:ANDGO_07131.mRNA.1 Ribosome maturation protein SDO1 homolog